MSEVFERLCPRYMAYGMSYENYWHGDPWAMRAYKQANNLKNRQTNEMMWINGMYVTNALSVVLSNAFSKKGTPPKKYLEKPLDIFPKTDAEIEAEKEQKQRELIAKLSAWKTMFDTQQQQNQK